MNREEYLKAKNDIQEYELQMYQKFIPEFTCICCKTNKVKVLNPEWKFRLDRLVDVNWNDGGVFKLYLGFGSRFDYSYFYAAVCDDCIEANKDNSDILLSQETVTKQINSVR